MLSVAFQWIGVIEEFTGQIHAGQMTIVEGFLHHINILAVAGGQKHTVLPEFVGNDSAGFLIGFHIGQKIIFAKALESAVVSTLQRLKSPSAGKMGFTTEQVGDLVVGDLVSESIKREN